MCYVYIVIGKMNVNIVFTCPFIFCKSHCVQIVGFLKFNELIGGAAVFSITIDCPVAAQQEHLCCCVLCVCVCSLMLSGLYNRLHIWQSRSLTVKRVWSTWGSRLMFYLVFVLSWPGVSHEEPKSLSGSIKKGGRGISTPGWVSLFIPPHQRI